MLTDKEKYYNLIKDLTKEKDIQWKHAEKILFENNEHWLQLQLKVRPRNKNFVMPIYRREYEPDLRITHLR